MKNQIPKNWQKVKLSDICFPISESFDFNKIKKFIFINTGDIKEGKFIHRNYFNESHLPGQAKKTIKKDDILYSEIRPKNKHFAYIDFNAEEYVVSTKLMVIRNRENVAPRYLYLLLTNKLTTNNFQTIAESRSGTFPQLTFDAIANYEIMLPDWNEQLSIFKFISSIDDKIEMNNKIAKNLEEMAQTLFKEWFIKFRFPGYEKAKFADSELGKIPKGWTVQNIGDICETFGGGTPRTNNETYWQDGQINWATPTDMTSLTGPFIFDTEKKITDKGLKNSSSRLLPIDSILMTSRATVGILAISKTPICTNQGFIAVVCSNYPSQYFMFCLIKNRLGQIRALATGSTFPEISRGVFRKIKIVLPDEDTVLQFNQIVKPMFEKIAIIMQENQKLAALRDLLLPKLMKGEIRV